MKNVRRDPIDHVITVINFHTPDVQANSQKESETKMDKN